MRTEQSTIKEFLRMDVAQGGAAWNWVYALKDQRIVHTNGFSMVGFI